MSTAEVIAALVETRAGLDLPVRLRAWDGSETGPVDAPVLVWRLYLAGGALAFEQGRMGVNQILARRPPR